MKRPSWVVLGLIVSSLFCSTTAVCAAEALSPGGLPPAQIGAAFDRYIEENRSAAASASVAVFDQQQTYYQKQFGYDDRVGGIAASPSTVYEWGSVTKLLVWLSVMQLWEQGKLELDADIATYLPKGFLRRSFDRPITLLHLMHHTAGFQELVYSDTTSDPNSIVSLAEAVQKYHPSQIYPPGEVYSYSNWSAALAGLIVERVSGEPFDQYARRHIFEPLGMRHTSLKPDCSDVPWVKVQRKKLHAYTADEGVPEDLGSSLAYILLYPAGSATGTLDDFVRFGRALLGSDGSTGSLFLKPSCLETFLSPSSYYANTRVPRSCHGLLTLQYHVPVIGHDGSTDSCSCSLWFDPVTHLAIAVMTNQVYESAYNFGLPQMLFGVYRYPGYRPLAPVPDGDIDGIYLSARDYMPKGFLKVFSLLEGCMGVASGQAKNESIIRPSGSRLICESDSIYTLNAHDCGTADLVVKKVAPDGRVLLEFSSNDYLRASRPVVYAQLILLILGVLAALYAAAAWLSVVGASLRERRLGKAENLSPIVRLHDWTLGAITLSALLTLLLLGYDGFISMNRAAVKAVPLALCSMVPLMYAFALMMKRGRERPATRVRRCYRVTAVLGLVWVANVFHWQWYDFWSR